MLLSYEDAYFYKILLQVGFIEEVNNWINSIAEKNESLEGINLDLVWSLGNTNNVISCLHNYIGDNKINDKEVCEKLRLFFKDKLDNNQLTIDEIGDKINSISSISNKWNNKHWNTFYHLSIYDEYCISGLMDRAEYRIILKEFIDIGNEVNVNKFWQKHDKENKKINKNELKYKIIWTITLIIYFGILMLLSFLAMKIEKNLTGSISDKSMGIHIICLSILFVPLAVISALDWDLIYSFLTKENRNKRRKYKIEKAIIDKERKRESEELRKRYKLSESILTSYEYSFKIMKHYFGKRKWILFGLCEILCLSMTVGSVFYFDLISTELGIFIMLLGLVIGIYGFCILCDTYIKGLIYSFGPILCYALPLVIVYYLFKINTEWIIGLSTILCGSLLFIIFIIFAVVIPMKKTNNTYMNYWKDMNNKYSEIDDLSDYVSINNYLIFYKKDGSHVVIIENKNNESSIHLKGNRIINKVLLKDVTIDYFKLNDTFDNCVKTAISLLENHK